MNMILRLLLISLFISSCSTSKISSPPMEYVTVCNQKNDCKKLSRLIMGTDHLIQGNWTAEGSPEMNEKQVQEVLDEAMKLGINFYDTSPIYVGGVERALGKWMKSREELVARENYNPDRKLYALSKGGFPFDLYYSKKLEKGTHSKELKETLLKNKVTWTQVPSGSYASRLFGSQEQIEERVANELEHSLSHLEKFLTVYLMHRDDGDYFKFKTISRKQTPVKTILSALNEKKIASRYWGMGVSNWQTARVNEALELSSKDNAYAKPLFNSPYFSLFEMGDRTIHAGGVQVYHEEMNDPKFQEGIKMMSYSPLGGFSIMDKPESIWENAKKSAKEKYDQNDPYWQNVYPAIFTSENEERFKRLISFTEKFNTEHKSNYTLDQMMNAYVLAHKRADFVAIGPITVEQLRRTVEALKISHLLTEADLDYLHKGK